MAQDLTTTSSSSKISRREAEAKIEAFHGRLEPIDGHPTRFCVPRALAPTTAEHRLLSAVQSRLEQELEPCANRRHIEAAVNRLLNGFDIGNGPSDENAATLNAEFVEACETARLPLVAIVAAASRFRSATTLIPRPNHRFRPMPPEFVEEARAGLVPTRTKLVHVRRIIAAEVYDPPTPEQLAKVKEAAAAFLEDRGFPGERRAGHDARDELALTVLETVRPITGDISHLMTNLDRRRVGA